ncbi:MAG: polysaccharide deacetylase family protein [Candidatus Brocadiia bacterium]
MRIWPERVFALKVDIDTREGLNNGVPSLLDDFSALGLRASFFMSWGPDNSGRALLKLFTSPRFFLKMLRTRATRTYGWRTAVSGVLLPARMIGSARPDIVREIISQGSEVELHAWDHRLWQDTLSRRSKEWIADWFNRAISAHANATHNRPQAFAAPAWMIDAIALEEVSRRGFRYLSCTRAVEPFLLAPTGLPEIPGNIPCTEEVGGMEEVAAAARAAGGGVLTLHAEVEGGPWKVQMREKLLLPLMNEGYKFVTTGEMAARIGKTGLKERRHEMRLLRGRSEPCAV